MAANDDWVGNLSEYNEIKKKIGKERFFALEGNNFNCYGKQKDKIGQKAPKYSLDLLKLRDIKLDKNQHENILCIEHDDKTVFLMTPSKEVINQCYKQLKQFFDKNNQNDSVEQRERSNTERYTRRPIRTPRPTALTAPNLGGFMQNAIEYDQSGRHNRRPLPPIPTDVTSPPEASASKIDINKLNEVPCCVRHHVILGDGRNFDTENQYENIHFIRNIAEWEKKTESRKEKLNQNQECYMLAGQLHKLQIESDSKTTGARHNAEPIYMNATKSSDLTEQKRASKTPPALPGKPRNNAPPIAPKPKRITNTNTSDEPCSLRSQVLDIHATKKWNVRTLLDEQGKTVTVNIPKQTLLDNKIQLAEINNGIWFGGPESIGDTVNAQTCWLMFGDQLVQVNDQWLDSAEFAENIIQTTSKQEVSLCVKRLPHAQIVSVPREYRYQGLGLECHSREVTNVIPGGLASIHGRLRPEATGIKGMNCTWTITHVNSDPIPPNISTHMMEEKLQMAGDIVHLIVQPTDFVEEIKSNCKN